MRRAIPNTTSPQILYSCLMNSEAPCVRYWPYLFDFVSYFYDVQRIFFVELESIELFRGIAKAH